VRNQNTETSHNNYGVVSAYLLEDETVFSTLLRSVEENLGITIKERDLSVVLSMQLKKEGQNDFVVFVQSNRWKGEFSTINEKVYDDYMWVNPDLLPLNTEDHLRRAIHCYKKGIYFTVYQPSQETS